MKIRGRKVELPDEGPALARLVGLVDLGHQKGWDEEDPSKYQIELTYELVSSEMSDGRPFFVNEKVTNSDSDKSTLFSRMQTFGVTAENIKDALGRPCMVTVKTNPKGTRAYPAGKAGVSGIPAGMPVADLRNNPFYFDPYDPNLDMAIFDNFPEWKQGMFKEALDYNEMALKDLLENGDY